MQVLPRNATLLGVAPDQLSVPKLNILAGTRLLAILLRQYRGDLIAALVAYNARPRRLFAPLPENGETAPYVRRVIAHWRSFERCRENS
jgi:soluble lytic murein transglycosylase-like protein